MENHPFIIGNYIFEMVGFSHWFLLDVSSIFDPDNGRCLVVKKGGRLAVKEGAGHEQGGKVGHHWKSTGCA